MLFVIAILTVLLLPALARALKENRGRNYRENWAQIGKALYVYRQNFNEFYPFIWAASYAYDCPVSAAAAAQHAIMADMDGS